MLNESKTCEEYRARLFDYASDLLDSDERAELELHINSCPGCRAELAAISAMLEAAADIPEVEAPDGLENSVIDKVMRTERAAKRRIVFKRAMQWTVPLAACAAIAVGVYSSGLYSRFISSDDMITSGGQSGDVQNKNNSAKNDSGQDISQNTEDSAKMEKGADDNGSTNSSSKKDDTAGSAPASSSKTKAANGGNGNAEAGDKDRSAQKNSSDTIAVMTGGDANENNATKESNNSAEKRTESIKERGISGASAADGAEKKIGKRDDISVDSDDADDGSYRRDMPVLASVQGDTAASDALPEMPEAVGGSAYPTKGFAKDNDMNNAAAPGYSGGSGSSASLDEAAPETAVLKDERIPSSCIITADNPVEFAKGFGVSVSGGDEVRFKVKNEKWQEFKEYNNVKNSGAPIEEIYSDAETESVDVTVRKN